VDLEASEFAIYAYFRGDPLDGAKPFAFRERKGRIEVGVDHNHILRPAEDRGESVREIESDPRDFQAPLTVPARFSH
jgi:hypothetical protein